MNTSNVVWKGQSSRRYEYSVHELNTDWADKPGNYIYAKIVNGAWRAVYIGQTNSFKNRLPNHNELPCINRNGATHVHAHVNMGGEAVRKAEEADLIAGHKPPCNDQGK
jgi:hypothetical protein